MSNRTRNEIIIEMLKCMLTPALQTDVMYGARLSYSQLKSYGNLLRARKLIESSDGKWVVTEKGRSYLKAYAVAAEILADE